MVTKDEALQMAIEAMDWELGGEPLPTLMIAAKEACILALTPAQQQWVGLSDDDFNDASWFTDEFIEGANWAQNKLKELNT